MVNFFYCRLKIHVYKQREIDFKVTFDIKSYPEQKPKCLKLTKFYLEKKQYIDFAW